ncbi:MAG: hypothetical protein AMXMBFR33_73590 [Candidatus Xenobia bacterium]
MGRKLVHSALILLIGATVGTWGLQVCLRHAYHPRLIEYRSYRSPLERADGVITGKRDFYYHWYHNGPSDQVVRDDAGNVLQVYDYRFQAEELTFNDCAYSFRTDLPAGHPVVVEYPAGKPEQARVQGMSSEPIPFWTGVTPYLAALIWMTLISLGTWRTLLAILRRPREG